MKGPRFELSSQAQREAAREAANEELENVSQSSAVSSRIDDNWQVIKNILLNTKNRLTSNAVTPKKPWMTNDILADMEERRKWKQVDRTQYNLIDAQIKAKIKRARENFWLEQCRTIEDLDKRHDSFNLHKMIKQVTGKGRKKVSNILKNENGNLIIEPEVRLNTWKEYIEKLFEDNREQLPISIAITGPEILEAEVENANKKAKNRVAVGPDDIPIEVLKLLEEKGIKTITKLFNDIYNEGKFPSEWLRSIFIPLPKKSNPTSCSDYRTISLMSHMLKIFLKVIHNKITRKLKAALGEEQFGFRNGLGTRGAWK